jgi:hypothetical protein
MEGVACSCDLAASATFKSVTSVDRVGHSENTIPASCDFRTGNAVRLYELLGALGVGLFAGSSAASRNIRVMLAGAHPSAGAEVIAVARGGSTID